MGSVEEVYQDPNMRLSTSSSPEPSYSSSSAGIMMSGGGQHQPYFPAAAAAAAAVTLSRTPSMDSTKSPPAKPKSRLERQSKLSTSNPKLAWKELNDGLNNLFSSGSGGAPNPIPPPGSPLMRKSHSRPNLPVMMSETSKAAKANLVSDETGAAAGATMSSSPGNNAAHGVYHTVHGAGRKNAMISTTTRTTTTTTSEPFSKIGGVRSRNPSMRSEVQDLEDEFFIWEAAAATAATAGNAAAARPYPITPPPLTAKISAAMVFSYTFLSGDISSSNSRNHNLTTLTRMNDYYTVYKRLHTRIRFVVQGVLICLSGYPAKRKQKNRLNRVRTRVTVSYSRLSFSELASV